MNEYPHTDWRLSQQNMMRAVATVQRSQLRMPKDPPKTQRSELHALTTAGRFACAPAPLPHPRRTVRSRILQWLRAPV